MRTTSSDPIAVWMGLMGLVMDHKLLAQGLLQEASGMPWSRYRALRRVEDRGWSQRELAEAMRVDASAMSGIVDDLVERGYAERVTHPQDARMKLVTITESGRDLMEHLRTLPGVVPPPVATLTHAERRELARLVDKMRAAAEA
ncbi:MarR family winged helix-turn-helix transcriptional regulator [Nocardioides jiangxiensis]|uniref:MarR family transcriptional regulator n=1 Tax=Nocardioides jiangxiensis TaxID=3064524 RepID=A0ABT9AX86_9ACTN|nr:MarR family transcriptional regulator [Nocardioides sp. WY-20]MDO7867141.1 MarR family transcriptional regulator [Nocardioides sp. WY-20]